MNGLRPREFYTEYEQHGGSMIIPTEIFDELYDDATEEIERLNNIINEFEDWLNAKYEEMHDIWYVKVLNKLKELKRK